MNSKSMTIGHLARETGCKIPTIRYYEKIGLLPEPSRSAGNTRVYNPTHRERLGFIRHCRELGFSQAAIRELLNLSDQPDSSCVSATQISQKHLDDINQKIDRLSALKEELEHMIAACSGGKVAQCHLIETLADHSHEHCLGQNHTGALP